MVFSSITFIFYFLVIVISLYAIAKGALRNGVLLLSSLFFYFYGEGKMTIILIAVLVFSYYYARFIEIHRQRIFLALGLVITFLPLVYYKYSGFILENFGIIYRVALPLGISFFSFQAASYIIDVYRAQVKASRSILNYGTYLTFFGQLVAGPIVRYETIAKEVERERKIDIDECYYGLRRFTIGFAKKCIIANTLGAIVLEFEGVDSSIIYWSIAIFEVMQLYFDFSAYSDMAIGLGLVFGLHFLENFDYPLYAPSIRDFWRRWHMSLGTWFKDYVYFPLGGSRCKTSKHIFNLLLVWLLTGLWHGAAYSFIIWGLYFGIFIILERYTPLKKITEVPILRNVYCLLVVFVGFVFFNHSADPFGFIIKMFTFEGALSNEALYLLSSYLPILIISCILASPLLKKIYERFKDLKWMHYLEALGIIVLFIGSLAYLVGAGFDPFLYFRF